jgi:hypothetical protein
MNLSKIFDLFDYKPENNDLNEKDNVIIDLYEKPLFWVGMFEKLIQNNNVFKQQVKNNLQDDFEQLNEASDAVIYIKAYLFLTLLNLDDENHIHAIKSRMKYGYLQKSLEWAMNYFISQEEYEKCIFLKEILKLSQESLET